MYALIALYKMFKVQADSFLLLFNKLTATDGEKKQHLVFIKSIILAFYSFWKSASVNLPLPCLSQANSQPKERSTERPQSSPCREVHLNSSRLHMQFKEVIQIAFESSEWTCPSPGCDENLRVWVKGLWEGRRKINKWNEVYGRRSGWQKREPNQRRKGKSDWARDQMQKKESNLRKGEKVQGEGNELSMAEI